MILDEYVSININNKNIQHLKEKGYEVKYGEQARILVEHLSKSSHAMINAICDVCGAKKQMEYRTYLRITNDNNEKYYCAKCVIIKRAETNLKKYGVKAPAQHSDIQQKMQNTTFEKYGVYNAFQSQEIKDKIQLVLQNKYGVMHPLQSEEIKQKAQHTLLMNYGVINPMKNQSIRAKATNTLYQNHSIPTSTQQKYLHNLYGGILNYPCSSYALDVYLPEYNLDIEYNGGGHDLSVQMHGISQQDFNIKEIIRGKTIRSMGINQMTIISSKDFLPKDAVLLSMLNQTVSFFNETGHHWITFDLDTSCFKNVTGTYPYDFGELISKRTLYTLMSINEENNIEEAS